jgi:hypothetical protein
MGTQCEIAPSITMYTKLRLRERDGTMERVQIGESIQEKRTPSSFICHLLFDYCHIIEISILSHELRSSIFESLNRTSSL